VAAAPVQRPQTIVEKPVAPRSVQKTVAPPKPTASGVAGGVKRASVRSTTITPRRVLVACASVILIGVGQASIPRDPHVVPTAAPDLIAAPPIAARTLPPSTIVQPVRAPAAPSQPRSKEPARKPAAELASAAVSKPGSIDRRAARVARSPRADSIAATAPGDQWLSPRLLKLGIRASWRGSVIGLGDPALVGELQQALAQVSFNRLMPNRDVIFLGAAAAQDVRQLDAARSALKSGGVLWVVVPPDAETAAAIEEHARSAALLPQRRVDLSPTQHALAFVFRVDRSGLRQRTES
jgi:hypothetical protein